MVMPTRHGKSALFMILLMVINQTIIVVVPLIILVSGREADVNWTGLWYATYDMDTITFDDPPSILFISMERLATQGFVELAHTLNHLQKLHCVIVHEAYLLLLDFKLVMKCMLALWDVGCQLVTLTTFLSPYQKTNIKIVMSTTFTIIQMSMVCPLIGYVVDELVDVDNQIIQQFIGCDYNVSSNTNRVIVYCLTRQFVEWMASSANNVACARFVHLHAHLDENTKKM
jgi:superfamily II DNA helicase RecQ